MKIFRKNSPEAIYWREYGGFRGLLTSRELKLAIALTLLCWRTWTKPEWWETPISVLPNLFGFTLGAYAVLVAFGNDRFLRIITTPLPDENGGTKGSMYAQTSAAFVHYLLVQMLSLFLALLCRSWYGPVWTPVAMVLKKSGIDPDGFARATQYLWFVPFCIFIYGLLCGVAAVFRVFLLTRWFSMISSSNQSPDIHNQSMNKDS